MQQARRLTTVIKQVAHRSCRAAARLVRDAGVGMLGACGAGLVWAGDDIHLRGTPVQLDAHRLAQLQTGEALAVRMPLLGTRTWVMAQRVRLADGRVAWQGHLAERPATRVQLQGQPQGRTGTLAWQAVWRVDAVPPPRTPATALPALQAWRVVPTPAGSRDPAGHARLQVQATILAQAELDTDFALPLPDGRSERVRVTRRDLDAEGFLHIEAHSIGGGASAPTVLSISPQGMFGVVYSQGREYQVVTRQGDTWMLDPQAAGWTPPRGEDHLAAHGPDPLPTAGAPDAAPWMAAMASTGSAPPATAPLRPGTVDTVIPLVVTYSPSLVTQWGTEALARLRLSNLVRVANVAYGNSGTGIAFRISGWALVRQPDTTPQAILPVMRAGSGNFSGLPALKASTGAALVVFFAPFNATTGSTDSCGLAYVPGSGAQGLAGYRAQIGSLAYAALNDGQSGNRYCEASTLAHELGHLLGNAHDKANSSFAGVFSYSYGRGVSGVFGTVMSYIAPRVALFASPQLRCTDGGTACGSDSENVVATMLQTKSALAALGDPNQASASSDGATTVAGWLSRSDGSPYVGSARIQATNGAIACKQGSTGLYVCRVPQGVSAVSLRVSAPGMSVSPSLGSFPVTADAANPIQGTRFYLSAR